MGLTRKLLSISSGGGIKYTSKREAQTKAAAAQARVSNKEARLLDGQLKAQAQELSREHVAGVLEGTYPKWRLTTSELLLLRKARKEEAQAEDQGS